jgi:hypothetical protein
MCYGKGRPQSLVRDEAAFREFLAQPKESIPKFVFVLLAIPIGLT